MNFVDDTRQDQKSRVQHEKPDMFRKSRLPQRIPVGRGKSQERRKDRRREQYRQISGYKESGEALPAALGSGALLKSYGR